MDHDETKATLESISEYWDDRSEGYDAQVKKEEGEIQLTNYGVSGICVFNLSRYVSIGIEKKKEMLLKINFMPFLEDMTKEEVWQWFSFRGSS